MRADHDEDHIARVTEIWADDLLGRRREAELLIGYLESVYARSEKLTDGRAHTIAIDGSYGKGKTFFLRRLAQTLALQHPVAMVDAWADDLSDEPMTALAATLKKAIDPLLAHPDVRAEWAGFASKAGKVAAIAGAGLLKRSLSILITGAAVDAALGVMGAASEEVKGAVADGLADASKDAVDDVAGSATQKSPKRLMETRISEFEDGQAAIVEMKQSLSAVVNAIGPEGIRPPIFIIIDELDRCRPTYAIKVMEEIKHLFDVPGLVFVFGLHGDQLAHSIAGAYGPGFDGKGYLRRFINRRYSLASVDLQPLVNQLFEEAALAMSDFKCPRFTQPGANSHTEYAPQVVIAEMMKSASLSARDSFEVIDILQTCVSLAKPYHLHLIYLLALIFEHIKQDNSLIEMKKFDPLPWNIVTPTYEGKYHTMILPTFLEAFAQVSSLSQRELLKRYNEDDCGYVVHCNFEALNEQSPQVNLLAQPGNYRTLLATVDRFQNPSLDKSAEEQS